MAFLCPSWFAFLIPLPTMKIWRRIVAFLLLAGIVANCFNYSIIFSSYQFNKSYITSVLCTNKDKPHLHCQGKCFLDIKLKELEKKNKQEQNHLKNSVETVAPIQAIFNFELSLVKIKTPNPFYLQQKAVGVSSPIYHPPQFIA